MFRSVVTAAVAVASASIPSVGFGDGWAPTPGVVAGVADETHVSVSVAPVVHVRGADPQQRSTLDEALTRFRLAGLELPELDVRFSEDAADCLGHDGLFDSSRSPWRVTICSGAEFVPTHELAHAWETAHLDDADRDHYREVRGFETWSGNHVAWVERAMEDAAFTIQQNLMAGDHVDGRTERWQARAAAYELLTGQRSPVLD